MFVSQQKTSIFVMNPWGGLIDQYAFLPELYFFGF
jgi:hypothetical protein